MHTMRVMVMVFCLMLGMSSSFAAPASDMNWLENGWHKTMAGDHNTALNIWQKGVDRLADKHLLASVGVYAQFTNALDQLKRLGPKHKAFIIRSQRTGSEMFYVLSYRDTAANLELRQQQLADLKQAAGISGLLYAAEAGKFKHSAAPAHPVQISKAAGKKQPKSVKWVLPGIKAAPASTRFSINRFEVTGNSRIPTDSILIGLREFYGDKRTRKHLKQIKRRVADLYYMEGFYKVRVKVPSHIEDDTVFVRVDESRL